jgi:hypothetical protein
MTNNSRLPVGNVEKLILTQELLLSKMRQSLFKKLREFDVFLTARDGSSN